MLADCEKSPKPFDAIIVTHTSRWSRDNADSKVGVEVLRANGIDLYTGFTKFDLDNHNDRFMLGIQTEIAERDAAEKVWESIHNRLARARRGHPTCGKLPWGRVFDGKVERWGIDPEKQRIIIDVADRYIRGESLKKLASEYGMNHANLCKILRERCGSTWSIEFKVKSLKIHEVIPVEIPSLLPPEQIARVQQKLTGNRTYDRKPPNSVHNWLLKGRIHCAGCGYAFYGQMNPNGKRYYRHSTKGLTRTCSYLTRKPYVPADWIEGLVVRELFDMFGSPAHLERAVRASVPDAEKGLRRLEELGEEIEKVRKGKERIVGLIAKDVLSDEEAEKQLRELNARGNLLREERDRLAVELESLTHLSEDLPEVHEFETPGRSPLIVLMNGNDETFAGGNDIATLTCMSWQDRRDLILSAFDGPFPDGSASGVYISMIDGEETRRQNPQKKFKWELRGRFAFSVTSRASYSQE